MFNLISYGEIAGSGVPDIFSVWQSQGWDEPIIEETSDPDRTTLVLSLKNKSAIKTSDKSKKRMLPMRCIICWVDTTRKTT